MGTRLRQVGLSKSVGKGGLVPDLTFLFDLLPEVVLRRVMANPDREWNRMDALALEFHEQVREAYLIMARNEVAYSINQTRWEIIDAAKDKDEVYQAAMEIVCNRS